MKTKSLLSGLLFSLSLGILCGCSFDNEPITVTYIDENHQVIEKQTITLRENKNVPELRYTWPGHNFRGWAYEADATSPKIKPGNTLKYTSIKNVAVNHKLTMYSVWHEKAELCIAWDAYTTASGLTDVIMGKIKTELVSNIEKDFGFTPTINTRAYSDQAIEDKTAAINKHGDVDITFGFANTINKPSTGNLLMTAFNGAYDIRGTVRTLGKLNNKDLSTYAYNWLNTPENLDCLGHGRTSSKDLVIGWGWNGNAANGTSVIDYQSMKKVESNLVDYLSSKGFNNISYTIRPYRNSPANTCGELINTDGDVDILVGFGSNIPLQGEDKGNVEVFKGKAVKINDYSRYIFQLNTGSPIVNTAFNWLIGDGLNSFVRDEHKLIKVGFDMRSTSGLTSANVNSFKDGLNSYISTLNYQVEYLQYTGDTKEIGESVYSDNIDIMIGMGSNFNSEGGITFYATSTVNIGAKEQRRIIQTVGNQEVTDAFNWINESGLTLLGASVKGQ